MIQRHAWALVVAMAIDFLLGDIEKFPHPVRFIGSAYTGFEKHFKRQGSLRVFQGIIAVGVIGFLFTAIPFFLLFWIPHGWIHLLVEGFLLYWCLSVRNLSDEVLRAARALKQKKLPLARRLLSRVVGRDTLRLSSSEISRALIETVGESFVDGFFSPVFWGFLLGAPGAFFFKVVSTGDSMIGHPEVPYRKFGWAAAKLDDALNWIPARLCWLFLAPAAFLIGASPLGLLKVFQKDRLRHPSPNAGHGEAAWAGALGVRLGGNNYYDGKLYRQIFLNAQGRLCGQKDVIQAVWLLWVGAGLVFLFLFGAGRINFFNPHHFLLMASIYG